MSRWTGSASIQCAVMQVRLALLLAAPQPLEHVMGTFLAATAGEQPAGQLQWVHFCCAEVFCTSCLWPDGVHPSLPTHHFKRLSWPQQSSWPCTDLGKMIWLLIAMSAGLPA